MGRLDILITTAARTKAVNQAFGTAYTPDEVAAQYTEEDCDLLLEWQRWKDKAS